MIELLTEAGFAPADDYDVDIDVLSKTERATIEYFGEHGWQAARREEDWLTFVRWSEDGIELMTTTLSGVTTAEARFSANRQGIDWLAAAIAS